MDCAKNTFHRLKGRWQRLAKCNDMNIENVTCVIAACCILHNMCEVHGDSLNELWMKYFDMSTQPHPVALYSGDNAKLALLLK